MAKALVHGIMRDLEAEENAYNTRWAIITGAAQAIHGERIAALCARHELESDEFFTREEKAERMMKEATR